LRYSLLIFLFPVVFAACSKNRQGEVLSPVNSLYDKAFLYRDSGVLDSSFLFFNEAREVFSQQGDSLVIVKCLLNIAIISNAKGDYFGSQELSLNATHFFKPQEFSQQVYIQSNYNNLGMTLYNLKDFSQAIHFYNIAKKYTSDSAGLLIIENNIANAYRRSGNLQKSLYIYSNILNQKISEIEFARTLSNYEYTKWLQNPKYDASFGLLRALKIRRKIGDLQGQISSYTYLTDHFSPKHPNTAAFYANEMYLVAKKVNNPNDKLEALQRLVRLTSDEQSKIYFDIHQILNDSLQTVRNAAKNQFALIRYESEKSKADNLKLLEENSEKTYQVNKQKIVTYLILLFMIVVSGLGFYSSKRRKERLERSALNKIKEGRLQTSKKVHDVVANGLYRVMTEIENQSGIGKDEILDRLDGMYQKSRDISYEVEEQQSESFRAKIAGLLKSFESEQIKVRLNGNTENLWIGVSISTRHQIEHILQELMVNMDKHSGATKVSLMFKERKKQITILYSDNGIGLQDQNHLNNGLKNTGNRIKNIQGKITFESNLGKGLRINISFPVS
jgi:tetratricopeptide (TPR) repeat protein